MFKIIKKGSGNFWHNFNNGSKEVNLSDWEIVLDSVNQTVSLQMLNGANVPINSVFISDILIIDETDGSVEETFVSVEALRIRLVELNYTPYIVLNGFVPEAPVNGLTYGRKDAEWVEMPVQPTQQYKFLLSQSGGDDPQTATSGTLTKGVTYEIVAFETGDDFIPSGAPNNDVGTKWIANGVAPTWSNGSEIGFNNAPVVNNNFGLNDFWLERAEYPSGEFTGAYKIKSDGKFIENKVFFPINHGFAEWSPDTQSYYGLIWIDENTILLITADSSAFYVDGLLNNTPISFEIKN